jgi:hypothetical protein
MEEYREQGYLVGKVEFFNTFAKPFGKRVDLFHIIDLLAIKPGIILGVQSTSKAQISAHKKKCLVKERINLQSWLEAGGKFVIIGWYKKKKKKSRKLWHYKVLNLTLADLNEI